MDCLADVHRVDLRRAGQVGDRPSELYSSARSPSGSAPTPCTISNWELNRTSPALRFIPGLIRFLGYLPFPAGDTLAEQLMACRTALGLPQAAFARLLGVGTLSRWEENLRAPAGRYVRLVQAFLEGRGPSTIRQHRESSVDREIGDQPNALIKDRLDQVFSRRFGNGIGLWIDFEGLEEDANTTPVRPS